MGNGTQCSCLPESRFIGRETTQASVINCFMSSGLSTTDQQALEDSDTACIFACPPRIFNGVLAELVKDSVTQGRYNDSNSRLARAGRELAQDEGSAYSFAVDLVPWWNRMRQSDPESLTHIELRRDPAVPSIR